MNASPMSLFERLISRPRPAWVTLGVSLLLVLAPLGAVYLDGMLAAAFSQGFWRMLFATPVVVIYILIVSPILSRMDDAALRAFRPLVPLNDDQFHRLVNEASRVHPLGEVLACGGGVLFGVVGGLFWSPDDVGFWLRLYFLFSNSFLFGLLAWLIYYSFMGTRLFAALHRQPLQVDIFDTRPFEPIGRQSLFVALVFIGGVTLGMVFGLDPRSLLSWQNFVIYIPLWLTPILIFFFNMRDSHRVLAAAKNRELAVVQECLRTAYRTLLERVAAGENTEAIAAQVNALAMYEQRLQAVSTWPYNTAMLRTLFVSVLLPGGAALAKAIGEVVLR